MRRYQGYVVDSARWDRFAFRSDDIVISTPARCGTTWMQKVVGMLVFDRVEVGASLSTISPWLDMLIYTDEEIFRLLEEQSHRRFIKTHTPLDGIPRIPSVTYITVIRHPLDAALSYRDHRQNLRMETLEALRTKVAGPDYTWQSAFDDEPEEPDAYLRWFIDNAIEPTGSGPYGLADYCNQIRTYWDARAERNVHLFHYMDLWSDRDLGMRQVAKVLGVEVDEKRWPNFVGAAGLDSMRSRPDEIIPNAESELWESSERFFRAGGARDWASLLDCRGITHFDERLRDLAGDATDWVLRGGAALAGRSSAVS